VTAEDLAQLSPYLTSHILRFGAYRNRRTPHPAGRVRPRAGRGSTLAANSPRPRSRHGSAAVGGLAPPPCRATLEGRESSIAHAARVTYANVRGRALVRDRRRLDAGGSAAGPSRRAMPARRRRCCARGVRVQSATTAAGRADRRSLLPGGCAAVRPADAAADAVGAAHRQPLGAFPIRGRHRHRDGRVRRGCVVTMPTRAFGVRLPTPDPVRRRALQAVGAGAVPADARGRVV
jgi:hypothetical protein